MTEYSSKSPPHVFSSIPTQVYEQSSKEESENNFKNFKSLHSGSSNFETGRAGDNGDFSSLLPGDGRSADRKTLVKTKSIQPGQDQEDGNQWDRNHDDDDDTGDDDGETVKHRKTSVLSRVVNLLKSRKLSKRQRLRLVQSLLERQGPNFDGE